MRKLLILTLLVFSLNSIAEDKEFKFSSLNGKTGNGVMDSLKEYAVSKFNVTCKEPTGGQWFPDFNSNFTSKLECTSSELSVIIKASLKVIDKSNPNALYDKKVKVKKVNFDISLKENELSSPKQKDINDTAREDSGAKEKKKENLNSNKSHASKNL